MKIIKVFLLHDLLEDPKTVMACFGLFKVVDPFDLVKPRL